MKKALVISFSDLSRDPRVSRQIGWLSKEYEVYTAGVSPYSISRLPFKKIEYRKHSTGQKLFLALMLKCRMYRIAYSFQYAYKDLVDTWKEIDFSVVIANDVDTIPIALHWKEKAKIIADTHEYSPLEFEDQWRWNFFFRGFKTWLTKKFLPECNIMTSVCQGIADEYGRKFGVRGVELLNAPTFANLVPDKVKDGVVKIVHHGICVPSRKIEYMLDLAVLLPHDFKLILVLVLPEGSSKRTVDYYHSIVQRAKSIQNVELLDPVPFNEIPQFLNQFDLGLVMVPPTNFNYKFGLGNKFFEFIQARIGIVIGPLPEMARFVHQYQLGIVAKDFSPETLADEIRKLNPEQILQFKKNADSAAPMLCAEKSEEVFMKVVS